MLPSDAPEEAGALSTGEPYPNSSAFFNIMARVAWGTAPRPLNTLDTVFLDRPQASAMSCMVTLLFGIG